MLPARETGDLSTTWGTFVVLWGLPIALGVLASVAYESGIFSYILSYGLWIVAATWFGLGCLANARRCGRVHCWVDGIGMPALAVAGAISLSGLYNFSLGAFGVAFWVILVTSFCVEYVWKRYI